jgi:hypothetical protein
MGAFTQKPSLDSKNPANKAHAQFIDQLAMLARRGRSAGMRLIISAQEGSTLPTRAREIPAPSWDEPNEGLQAHQFRSLRDYRVIMLGFLPTQHFNIVRAGTLGGGGCQLPEPVNLNIKNIRCHA